VESQRLVWFRNDLRTADHQALYHACKESAGEGVLAVAVITPGQWLLQDEAKCRVQFWLANLEKLRQDLLALNIPLKVIRAATNHELPQQFLALAQQHRVSELYFNREYPRYEQSRDQRVRHLFAQHRIRSQVFDSDLVLAPGTVLNQQGRAYKVFTPFSKAWRRQFMLLNPGPLPAPSKQQSTLIISDPVPTEIGYVNRKGADWSADLWQAGADTAHRLLQQFVSNKLQAYPQMRDFPG